MLYCEPLQNSLPFLDKGVELGQAGINPLSAGYCVLLRAVNRFVQGAALDGLHQECERGLKTLQQSHQASTETMLRYGVLLPVMALRGQTLAPTSFDTSECSATAFFAGDYATPSIPLALYLGALTRHAYLLDDAAGWQRGSASVAMIATMISRAIIRT